MASVFRRRIAGQIISHLRPFLPGVERHVIYDALPLSLKYSQPKQLPPQFELSWMDVVKLKPELESRVHPTSVMTYLKNQEFPTSDGITDIFADSLNPEKMVFTIDQEIFSSCVLLDLCARIEKVPYYSTFFKKISPEKIVIDFSSPNIAKPFHLGHFRSTIIGNFIANICRYVGHDVTRINYVGDWGLQYGLLANGFLKFGCEEKLQKEPLKHLFEVYKQANELRASDESFNNEAKMYFKRMEDGDPTTLSLWKKLKELSLNEMNATYERLNIKFDEIHGESMYWNKVGEIYDILLKENLATCQEDGSIEVVSNTESEADKSVLRKSDGTSLYLSRDLAAAIDRHKKYHFDSMYYVVDSSQRKHFAYLKNILKSMNFQWASDLQHIPFGRITDFSTRKGKAVFLNNILDEAKERTLEGMRNSINTKVEENMEEVADILGIAALIINDFSSRRKKDYPFSWEKVLSVKGHSGVTLQYCHARLNNIKENCGVELVKDCEFACLTEPEAISLISHLAKFDEVIYHCYVDLEPCVLVHYVFGLRNEVGRAIKVLTVKGSSPYVARARLLLFHTAYLVLGKSLQILGITPLNKM
ncbi:hypothetical protein JTE90_013129 [Oedothorax gibbosus]|uniref:Probable arginine--tRNA ligase, mitochondrial n=1 Tax=Oedothorax gibbosus TaxID=931172 RepID=A0AAV6VJY0_9ARAC|nr:hypothetical protein JTE90_013129 [Oedothorax gibbosus]